MHPIENPFDELDAVLNSISKEDTFHFTHGGKIIYPNGTGNETGPILDQPSQYLKSSDNITRFKAIAQAAKDLIRAKLTSTSTQRPEYWMSGETTVTTSLEEVSTEFRPELKSTKIPFNFTAIEEMKRRGKLNLFKAALAAQGLIKVKEGDALTPSSISTDIQSKGKANVIEELTTEMRTQLKTTSDKMKAFKQLEELTTESIDDIKGEVDGVEENSPTPSSAQVMISRVPTVRTTTVTISVKTEPIVDTNENTTWNESYVPPARGLINRPKKLSTTTPTSTLATTESDVNLKEEVDSIEEISTEMRTQFKTTSNKMTTIKALEELTTESNEGIKGEVDEMEENSPGATSAQVMVTSLPTVKTIKPEFSLNYKTTTSSMNRQSLSTESEVDIKEEVDAMEEVTTEIPTQMRTNSNRMTTIKPSERLTIKSFDGIEGQTTQSPFQELDDVLKSISPEDTLKYAQNGKIIFPKNVTSKQTGPIFDPSQYLKSDGNMTRYKAIALAAKDFIRAQLTSTTTPRSEYLFSDKTTDTSNRMTTIKASEELITESIDGIKGEVDEVEENSPTSTTAQFETSPVPPLRITSDGISTKTQPIADTKTATTESDIDIKGEADVIEEISTEGRPQIRPTTDQDTKSKDNSTILNASTNSGKGQASSTYTTESDDDEEDVMLGKGGNDITTEFNNKLNTNKAIRSGTVVPKKSPLPESLSLNLKKIFGNNDTNDDQDDIILKSDQDSINKSALLPNKPDNTTASEMIVLDDIKNIPVNIFGPQDINLLKDLLFLRKNYKYINKDKLYKLLGLRIGEKDWKGDKGTLIRDKLKTMYKVNKLGDSKSKNDLVTGISPSTKLTATESDIDIKGEADVIEEISTEGTTQIRTNIDQGAKTKDNSAKGLLKGQISSTSTTTADDDEEDVMLGKGGNDITTESNQDNLSKNKMNEHANYTEIEVVSLDDVKNVTANIFGPKENNLLNTMIINRKTQKFVNKDKLFNLLESVLGEKNWRGEKGAMIRDKFKVKYKVQIKRVHFSKSKYNSMPDSTTNWTDLSSEDYITDSDVDDDNVTKSVQNNILQKKVLNDLANDENYFIEIKRKFGDKKNKIIAIDDIKNITGGLLNENETNTLLNSTNNTNGVNKDDLFKLLDSKIEAKKEIAKMAKDKFKIKFKGNYGRKGSRSKTNKNINNKTIGSIEDSNDIKDGADFVEDLSLSGNSSKNDLSINDNQLTNDQDYVILKDNQTEPGNTTIAEVLSIDDIKNISLGLLNENETNTLLSSINNNTKFINPDEFYKLLESKIAEKDPKAEIGSMIKDKFKIKFKDFRKRVFRPKIKAKFNKQLIASIDNSNDIKDEVDVAEEGPPLQNNINSELKQGNTITVPDTNLESGENEMYEPENNITDALVNSTGLNRKRFRLGSRLKGAFNTSKLFFDPAKRSFSKMGSNFQDFLSQRKNDGQDVLLKSFVQPTEQGDIQKEQIEMTESDSSNETSPGWRERLKTGYNLAKSGAKLALNATKVLTDPAKTKIMDMGSNIKNYLAQQGKEGQDALLKSFVLSTEQGDNSTEQIEQEETESSSETSPGSSGWKNRLKTGYKLAKSGAKRALNATKVLSEPAKAKMIDMGSNIKNYIEQRKSEDQDKVLQMKPDEIQSTEAVTESSLKTGLANLKNSKLFSWG